MTQNSIRATALALFAGIVFAGGLTLGGMTDPRKVQGFLNIGGMGSGGWDPSLAFVMAGAVTVSLLAFRSIRAGQAPWLGQSFELPDRKDIDRRLLCGAALFGIGWGLAGYCPGPAVASLLTGGKETLYFVAAMIGGMVGAKFWLNAKARGSTH